MKFSTKKTGIMFL